MRAHVCLSCGKPIKRQFITGKFERVDRFRARKFCGAACRNKAKPVTQDELVMMIKDRFSMADIAEKIGLSRKSRRHVRDLLAKYGLTTKRVPENIDSILRDGVARGLTKKEIACEIKMSRSYIHAQLNRLGLRAKMERVPQLPRNAMVPSTEVIAEQEKAAGVFQGVRFEDIPDFWLKVEKFKDGWWPMPRRPEHQSYCGSSAAYTASRAS